MEISSIQLKSINIVVNSPISPAPVLINGDFSNGTTGWTSNGGFATYSTTSASLPAVYNGTLWFSFTNNQFVRQTVAANLSGRSSVTLTCNIQHTQNDNNGGNSNGYTSIDTYAFQIEGLNSSNTVVATARTPSTGLANAPRYPTNLSVTLSSSAAGANWGNISQLRITLYGKDGGFWNGNWGVRYYDAVLSVA